MSSAVRCDGCGRVVGLIEIDADGGWKKLTDIGDLCPQCWRSFCDFIAAKRQATP